MADDRITIRKITADRREAWEKAAAADGRSLAAWIRRIGDQAAAKASRRKAA